MVAAHQEFIVLVNALVDSPNAEMLACPQTFELHAQAHLAKKSHDPNKPYLSAGCHLEKHQGVLKSIAEVIPLVAAGNIRIGRELAAELVRWLMC